MSAILKLKAYAKVNLFLEIRGRRADGFHEIVTILHNVSLADGIEVTPSVEPGLRLRVQGACAPRVGPAHENLMTRAAHALGLPSQTGVELLLLKQIPVAGGLGGGSADAAATLVALDRLWQRRTDRETLHKTAASIGSDVPFFLTGGTAVATGRGEKIDPLPVGHHLWFVLGTYENGLSTRDVYARWSGGSVAGPSAADMAAALERADPVEVAALLRNDLEAPALELRPELGRAKQALLDAGALAASVSGSGPAVFGIAPGEAAARAIARGVAFTFDGVFVVGSARRGVEVEP